MGNWILDVSCGCRGPGNAHPRCTLITCRPDPFCFPFARACFCIKHERERKPCLVQMVRISWLMWRGVPGPDDAASGPVRAARTSYLQAPLSSSPGRHTGRGVLGRADIALGFARKAIAILQSIETGPASTGDQVRRHVNPRFAEVVSLNTPGLRNGGAGGDPCLRSGRTR